MGVEQHAAWLGDYAVIREVRYVHSEEHLPVPKAYEGNSGDGCDAWK